MSCGPNSCMKTASTDGQGHSIMISVEGNKLYPVPHTPHAQCTSCALEMAKSLQKEMQALKDAETLGPELAAQWKRLKDQ